VEGVEVEARFGGQDGGRHRIVQHGDRAGLVDIFQRQGWKRRQAQHHHRGLAGPAVRAQQGDRLQQAGSIAGIADQDQGEVSAARQRQRFGVGPGPHHRLAELGAGPGHRRIELVRFACEQDQAGCRSVHCLAPGGMRNVAGAKADWYGLMGGRPGARQVRLSLSLA